MLINFNNVLKPSINLIILSKQERRCSVIANKNRAFFPQIPTTFFLFSSQSQKRKEHLEDEKNYAKNNWMNCVNKFTQLYVFCKLLCTQWARDCVCLYGWHSYISPYFIIIFVYIFIALFISLLSTSALLFLAWRWKLSLV